MRFAILPLITLLILGTPRVFGEPLATAEAIRTAINEGQPNDVVEIGEGTFEFTAPLSPKPGMTIRGAGAKKTTLTAASTWQPGLEGLPDKGVKPASIVRSAYLFSFADSTKKVTISDLKLTGENLHGAIFGNDCDELEIFNLHIEDFQWSSFRTFHMDHAKVHDCLFIDAGGKHGHNGGALYMSFVTDSEFWNNRIEKTEAHHSNFFGFKGRKATRCRFHHNTVRVGFSLELPFEGDSQVEIDHNDFSGPISIPKHAGGIVVSPEDGYAFHIHHNWLKRSYALEWARNSTIISHNLFDFDPEENGGNLITNFGKKGSPGPTTFHDNLVKNPGRGIFWSRGVFDNFSFYNNHVIANGLGRSEGLFGLPRETDFSTIVIRDNIIENIESNPRPLMRNPESQAALVENNTFVNVADAADYANESTGAPRGPREPLRFAVGVGGETLVDGFETRPNEAQTAQR